jgi:transposase
LSRFSTSEIARELAARGIAANISDATVWRWLSQDAIRPWRFRSWIFSRDPQFEQKAARVLDLYHGIWCDQPLGGNEYVLCADEKTSIQARIRVHPTTAPRAANPMRVEHGYERGGAVNYLAAWDVRRAKIFGRCEPKSGVMAFGRLVDQVMGQEPYRSAKRVFWIIDNGPSHKGKRCVERLKSAWPTIVPVHLPVHASWLNQIEIYFSIIQRKVLTPNYFSSLEEVTHTLLKFQTRYEQIAKPFQWKFTRTDLVRLMAKLNTEPVRLPYAA